MKTFSSSWLMPSMLLGTLEMEGFGTVMLDSGICADFDMDNGAWLAVLIVVAVMVVVLVQQWRGERHSLLSLHCRPPPCLLRWSCSLSLAISLRWSELPQDAERWCVLLFSSLSSHQHPGVCVDLSFMQKGLCKWDSRGHCPIK